MVAHVKHNSGNNEWYTPTPIIEAARSVMGRIGLDPASSDTAQVIVKADTYYTSEDNGLRQHWTGKVWLNPPYAKGLVERFAAKLVKHLSAGDVDEAILLTNNSTDTDWFQQASELCTAVCFHSGRIKFLDTNLDPVGGPLQGQVIMYFGKRYVDFYYAFRRFGVIFLSVAECSPGKD